METDFFKYFYITVHYVSHTMILKLKSMTFVFVLLLSGRGEQGLPVLLSALPEILPHEPQLVSEHGRPDRQHPHHFLLRLSFHRHVTPSLVPVYLFQRAFGAFLTRFVLDPDYRPPAVQLHLRPNGSHALRGVVAG